jgi:trk system potassium uptake protein TrkH
VLPQIWPAILTLGWILFVVAGGEGLMALVSLAASDGMFADFAVNAGVTAAVAGGCVLTTKGRPFDLRFRDAALLTVLSWFVVPAFAALPLTADPIDLTPADAYFEAVSGITTTGSTVLTGLDTMAPSILLWRATMQWLGGVGIIGLAIVILPFLKIGGMQLFRLESSDRSEKTMPRVRTVAAAVGQIYLVLTIACFMAYWLLGMTPFDALAHAFTTVCTGGFSTHDASFGYFHSDALDWASVVFMIAGGLPFLAYLQLVSRGTWRDRIDPQVIAFFTTVLVLSLIFATWLNLHHGLGGFDATTRATFSIVSIMTTTGYASVDYVKWGTFATAFFFMVSFIGGCTGSTSGGVKILRYQIMTGVVLQHIRQAIRPHVVSPIRYGNRIVTDDQVASVGTFVFVYFFSFIVFSLLMSLHGLDAATSLSAAIATLGNVGPGVAESIGPAGNFKGLPETAKLILSVAMITGRLEVMSLLFLFLPSFYR